MGNFIVLVPILVFTLYIIVKKVKDTKEGKSCCSDGCSGCSSSKACKP